MKNLSRAEADTDCGAVFDEEFVDGRVEAEFSTQIFQEFDEGLDEGAGAPHGKVDAPFALEVVDHGVDGGGLEGIASDEEGMEGEDFAEALRLNVARGHLPDGAIGAEADEVGSDAEHIGKTGERLVGKFDEGFLKNGVGFPDEVAVAFEIAGEMVADLGFHFGLVAGVFEGLAVVPSDSVEGFAGDDLDVVGGFFSCEGEEFIKKEGGGEDGGASVVGESFVAEDGSASAGLFEGFEEGDIVAAGLEADGGGEAAEA